ncbi:hypothetical protein B0H16DRAFT_1888862 [Mycena metata]|uniref:Uncharacterized protein n=1 Tax=Mycena metata TaxID=1033252 RepID=A0AAD7IPD7_9AGAR|nr:hypothetical protein B0H16DRAFT_1888862 [Mycena metata]
MSWAWERAASRDVIDRVLASATLRLVFSHHLALSLNTLSSESTSTSTPASTIDHQHLNWPPVASPQHPKRADSDLDTSRPRHLKTGPQKTSAAGGWCEVSSSREPGGDGRLRLALPAAVKEGKCGKFVALTSA